MTTVTPAQFLDRLYGNADEGWITVFSIHPKTGERRTGWFAVDQVAEVVEYAFDAALERDVWFGVATRREALPSPRRGGNDDCLSIPGLWVDIDIAGPNHKDSSELPDEAKAREMLAAFPLPPSAVVHSGGGLHAYWLFNEPVAKADADPLLERWATTWSQHAATFDSVVDNVWDICRVLRVPGTLNHKNGNPTPVTILTLDDHTYDPADVIEYTVEPPPAPTRQERSVPYTGAERPGDDFNARQTGSYVLGMLGWTLSRTESNGNEAWLHPWSPTSDCSATVYADDKHTTIWSSTVPRHVPSIETFTPYDPFGLYVRMVHGGDMGAATIELAKQGYGASTLRRLIGQTVGGGGESSPEPDVRSSTKPQVLTNGRHLDDLADEIVTRLVEANHPPTLFRHGEVVSRLFRGELEAVDRTRMVHVVEKTMRPVALRKDNLVPSRMDVAALDLAMLRLLDELPSVQGVMHAPFLRANGTVCAEPGYDPSSGNYLAATMHLDVPTNPTADQVAAAVAVIDDLICDFPLHTASDRAHVFALLLTPLIRHLVPLSPLFVLDGNGPGVGKNLLAESCMYITTGEWVQTDPLPLDAEEQRKQITALMSTGRSVALFDEAHIVTGTSLARLITSTTWGDRLLGYSKQVAYPNRITVVALGNNVEVQGDMPRRTIMVRLESQLARPYDRQDFRHHDLRAWVEEHRGDVLAALLTMLVAWSAAGRHSSAARLGSFDAWASIVGGTLEHAGVRGFLSNVNEMRDRGATDDVDMAYHLAELHGRFFSNPFTAGEVARLLDIGQLENEPPRLPSSREKRAHALGFIYRRYAGRWMGEYRLHGDGASSKKSRLWRVEHVASPPVDNSPEIAGVQGFTGSVLPTHENSSLSIDKGGGKTPGGEKQSLKSLNPGAPDGQRLW